MRKMPFAQCFFKSKHQARAAFRPSHKFRLHPSIGPWFVRHRELDFGDQGSRVWLCKCSRTVSVVPAVSALIKPTRIERCYSESHVLTSDVASIQGKVSTGDHVAIVKDKCRDPTLDLWFFFIFLIQLDHPFFSPFSLKLFR